MAYSNGWNISFIRTSRDEDAQIEVLWWTDMWQEEICVAEGWLLQNYQHSVRILVPAITVFIGDKYASDQDAWTPVFIIGIFIDIILKVGG